MVRRITLISLVTALAVLGLAGSAQGAIVIGQTEPPSPASCSDPGFGGQVQLTGGNYTVPVDGTITSWSAGSNEIGVQTKLLVLQPLSGSTFNVIAKSDFGTFTSTGVQTFAAQIPVRAGQVIGDWGKLCAIQTGGSEVFGLNEDPDPGIGTSANFPPALPGALVNLSATVEPSATTPPKHKKKCKKKKHKRSAESAKKKKCKKKKKR